ncbi:MAG: hypothetical protein MZV63_03345 [Marinilabiliales bacterium]|nr:hypothetical protein [Marinilabiliales bacterium]
MGSIRHADELSTTVIPASANLGAQVFDVVLHRQKKLAICGFLSMAVLHANYRIFFTLESNLFADRFFGGNRNKLGHVGKFRSSSTLIICVPTSPVAPTTATFMALNIKVTHSIL